MASGEVADRSQYHLVWKRTSVEGRSTLYGVAGDGPPVLFLHGWALGSHAYKRALKRLAAMGCLVLAPALPGFGGTADLPSARLSFAGYADWLAGFLDAVEVRGPAVVVGHSFGGGVAIQLAHDHPARVRTLVLLNSVGGSALSARGGKLRTLAERPLWDWGMTLPADVRIKSVSPRQERNGRITVSVGVEAKRVEDLDAFLEALEKQGRFHDVLTLREATNVKGFIEAIVEGTYQPGEQP